MIRFGLQLKAKERNVEVIDAGRNLEVWWLAPGGRMYEFHLQGFLLQRKVLKPVTCY